MTLLSIDQAIFFSVSAILLACLGNSLAVFRPQGHSVNERFWLWGLAFLPVAYLGYGLGPWLGLPSLIVANVGFLLAYVSLALQLRFWKTGKVSIPTSVYLACLAYFIGFEVLRAYFPYAARATFGQGTIWALTVYLLFASINLYRKTGSIQMLMLATTFAIESLCAASRVLLLWLVQIPGPDPTHLLAEPFYMVMVRWIWIVANAISYLTIMTYVLEKTLNRNQELGSLLKEKHQLLSAMTKLTRSRSASDAASALAHELAQPLTTIYLASQELQSQTETQKYQVLREISDLISTESARSTRIMQQLEKLFKSPNLPKQSVVIAMVLENALAVLEPRIKAHQIDIKRHGDFTLTVHGEPTQLEAVFVNLISNAINALQSQRGSKSIEINCSRQAQTCVIEFQDNGPGIDPLVAACIGKPYLSEREQGSGIGLWLSTLVLKTHQGSLEICNTDDSGALARVTLPIWQVTRPIETTKL